MAMPDTFLSSGLLANFIDRERIFYETCNVLFQYPSPKALKEIVPVCVNKSIFLRKRDLEVKIIFSIQNFFDSTSYLLKNFVKKYEENE